MTDQNLTECVCLIDKSRSMGVLVNDVIDSYNRLIAEQKNSPGKVNFTLIEFDNNRLVHETKPIADVPEMTKTDYNLGSCTALLDAIGLTIREVEARLTAMPEDQRPSKVHIMIATDGEENSSREFTLSQVKTMIEAQAQQNNWTFSFVGAGIDAFTDAGSVESFACSIYLEM